MIALYIIFGILALILALLLCRITVRVSYCRSIEVTVRYLFIKKTVFKGEIGGKNKSVTAAPPEKKEKKQKKPKKKEPEKETERPPLDLLLETVTDVLKKVLKKLGRSARLEHARLRCCVATDDPAKTAVLYGAVSGALGNVFVMLKSLKRRRRKQGTVEITAEPDFIAESSDIDVDVKISAVPLLLLIAAVSGVFGYIKIKSLWKERKTTK